MRFTSSASKLLHLVNYLISWPTPRKWCLSQVGSCVFRITPQEADVSPPVRSDRSVFTEPSHVSQPPLKSVFTPKPRSKVASPSILHAGLPTTFDKWSFFSPPHAHLSAHAEISLAQSQWSLVEIYLYMYYIYSSKALLTLHNSLKCSFLASRCHGMAEKHCLSRWSSSTYFNMSLAPKCHKMVPRQHCSEAPWKCSNLELKMRCRNQPQRSIQTCRSSGPILRKCVRHFGQRRLTSIIHPCWRTKKRNDVALGRGKT